MIPFVSLFLTYIFVSPLSIINSDIGTRKGRNQVKNFLTVDYFNKLYYFIIL